MQEFLLYGFFYFQVNIITAIAHFNHALIPALGHLKQMHLHSLTKDGTTPGTLYLRIVVLDYN